MAAQRITMRKIRDILRLRFAAGLSIRQIKDSTRVSVGAIQKLLSRAQELDLSWPLPDDLDDTALAGLFYPGADTRPSARFQVPDWSVVHHELKRKGVTLQLLWEEYTQQYPNRCYSYSQFCERYRHWRGKQKRSMRQTHKAGEKCFVDYCGQTVPIIDPGTGEIRDAQVFVGVLGASNYTYAEATYSQSLPNWLESHARMLAFFGGCPDLIIPDNLRSAVSQACRYDPDLNAVTSSWPSTIKWPWYRPGPTSPKTRPRPRWGYRSLNAGYWRACDATASLAWPNSISASAPCSTN